MLLEPGKTTERPVMKTAHKPHETPRARLERLARFSPPLRPRVRGPRYLIGVGLLLLIIAVIFIGVAGGRLGTQIFARHAQQVLQWVRPGG
jgi:hypothetical protein